MGNLGQHRCGRDGSVQVCTAYFAAGALCGQACGRGGLEGNEVSDGATSQTRSA